MNSVAAAMDQMNTSVHEVSTNAAQASSSSELVKVNANKELGEVRNMVEAIKSVQTMATAASVTILRATRRASADLPAPRLLPTSTATLILKAMQSPLHRAAVVCGSGNYDEVTPIGPTKMALLHNGKVTPMRDYIKARLAEAAHKAAKE